MKTILIAYATIMLFTLISCKKERTCECTTTTTSTNIDGNGGTTTYISNPEVTTTVYKEAKKSDLKTICGDVKFSNTYYTQSASSTISSSQVTDTKCELK